MRTPLFWVGFAVLLSSCTEYQYLTLSGTNIAQNDKHEFVSENDTMRIVYRFAHPGGKIMISLDNKTNQPLVIDWWKSAIISGNRSYSYYNPNAPFSGQAVQDTLLRQSRSTGAGGAYLADVRGTVFLSEPSQFLPPNTGLRRELITLPVDSLPVRPGTTFRTDTIHSLNYLLVRKRIGFSKEDSPLQLRSYLTFRIGRGGAEKEFTVEHRFYVSEIWKTQAIPDELPAKDRSRGDLFML